MNRRIRPALLVVALATSLIVQGSALAEPAYDGYLKDSYGQVVYDPVHERVYAHGFSGIEVYDGATNTHIDSIPLTWSPTYSGGRMAINPSTSKLYAMRSNVYVPPYSYDDMYVIDLVSKQVIKVLRFPSAQTITIDQTTNRVYVVNASGLHVVDGNTDELITIIVPDQNWHNFVDAAINPVTKRIYLTDNYGAGGQPELHVFDAQTYQKVGGMSFREEQGGQIKVNINTKTNRLYLGSYERIMVLDGTTLQVLADMRPSTDLGTEKIVINEEKNRAYFALKDNHVPRLMALDGDNSLAFDIEINSLWIEDLALNTKYHRLYLSVGQVWTLNEDATAPVSQFTSPLTSFGTKVEGRTTDDFAGVQQVTVHYASSGLVGEVPATLSCDEARRSCNWSASLPYHTGPMVLRVSSTDAFGNAEPQTDARILAAI